MFCITGWKEYEPSHPFSTPTDNWTEHYLLHISAGIKLDLSYFGKKYHCQIVLVENVQVCQYF